VLFLIVVLPLPFIRPLVRMTIPVGYISFLVGFMFVGKYFSEPTVRVVGVSA
jgi:hypothetical protein